MLRMQDLNPYSVMYINSGERAVCYPEPCPNMAELDSRSFQSPGKSRPSKIDDTNQQRSQNERCYNLRLTMKQMSNGCSYHDHN